MKGDTDTVKTQKITEFVEDDLQIDNSLTKKESAKDKK